MRVRVPRPRGEGYVSSSLLLFVGLGRGPRKGESGTLSDCESELRLEAAYFEPRSRLCFRLQTGDAEDERRREQ